MNMEIDKLILPQVCLTTLELKKIAVFNTQKYVRIFLIALMGYCLFIKIKYLSVKKTAVAI